MLYECRPKPIVFCSSASLGRALLTTCFGGGLEQGMTYTALPKRKPVVPPTLDTHTL